MAVTASSLRVNVPVLSEQRTSSVAASSTADNRVGSTPKRARAFAPSAAASVNVAGSATGMDARTAVRTRGIISPIGILRAWAYATSKTMIAPLKMARFRTTRTTVFCWVLSTWAVRTSSAVCPNFVLAPVAVTIAVASPRRTSAPA